MTNTEFGTSPIDSSDNSSNYLKIAIGFNYFDNKQNVERAFRSFECNVDAIIAVYGCYDDFDAQFETYKTSLLFVEGMIGKPYHNHVESIVRTHCPQPAKRNAYFEECGSKYHPKYDVLIVVDSDEWLQGDWEIFRQSLHEMFEKHPDVSVFGLQGQHDSNSYYPRIFRKPYNFRYKGAHCVVNEISNIDDTTKTYYLDAHKAAKYPIEGLVLCHSRDLRTKQHQEKQKEYHQIKKQKEKAIRDKYK